MQVAKRTGDVVELERVIYGRVKLIAISRVPTNGGLTSPVANIGWIARKNYIRYLLDACQAVGQMPVDVQPIRCDMLAATGRKFLRGPPGTGFLYIRRDVMLRWEPLMINHFAAPWIAIERYELRDDARRFETWEKAMRLGMATDCALVIGLGEI